jgi:DNA-binding CsgD family transcriptional regulator
MGLWHELGIDEPAEVRALRAQSDEVVRSLASVAAERPTAVQPLMGVQALVLQLQRIAPAATTSSWVMQPQYTYDPEEQGLALTRAARSRGIETELITLPATVDTHPLLSSLFPRTLLGPVFLRGLVIDSRHAIVGGPADGTGRRVAWYTTAREVVDDVIDLWRATLPLCRPILEPGQDPPLTERQLEVARLLCLGEKDQAIARALQLSARTVEREVRAVLDALGAASRTQAVLLMRGRGVNGGWNGQDSRRTLR